MDEKLDMEKQLNNLSIFSLRELARQTGVNSPTSKKKEMLITEIIAIREGRQQPVFKPKQGRPPKGYSSSWAEILNGELNSTKTTEFLVFNQDTPNFSYDDEDMITKIGFVQILENNTSFLWANEDGKFVKYFIPANLISKHNVKCGDKIVADVCGYPQMIVKEIYDVNNIAVKMEYVRNKDYSTTPHNFNQNNIKILDSNLDICYGENVFIYGTNNSNNTKTIINLLNNSTADIKIYINVSITEKNKALLLNLKNAENFTTSLMENIDIAKNVVNLAIEYAKRCFEDDKNVIIAIDDLLSLTCIDDENLTLTKNLLSLTKSAENGGSITIYAINTKQANLNIFEKLVDKRIILN